MPEGWLWLWLWLRTHCVLFQGPFPTALPWGLELQLDSGEDSSLHNNGCPVTSVKALSPNAPQLPQSKCNIFFQRHIFKSFVLLYSAYSVLPHQNGYVPTHGFSESSLVSALPRGSPHSRCLPPAHRVACSVLPCASCPETSQNVARHLTDPPHYNPFLVGPAGRCLGCSQWKLRSTGVPWELVRNADWPRPDLNLNRIHEVLAGPACGSLGSLLRCSLVY